MIDNYLHTEFENVLNAGPHAFEDCFRLVVSGKATSKHLNITTAETEIVRDVLHAARNLPDNEVRFLFKLIRASIEGLNRANADKDDSVKLDRHEREARTFASFVEAQGHSLIDILARQGPEDLVLTRDRFSPDTLGELAIIAYPDETDEETIEGITVNSAAFSHAPLPVNCMGASDDEDCHDDPTNPCRACFLWDDEAGRSRYWDGAQS